MTVLRVHTSRLGAVSEVVSYLNTFERAYNHLYAFDLILADAKGSDSEFYSRRYRRSSATLPRRISRPELVVLPEDQLRVHSVQVASPGFWDFAGSLSPLETLRKYLHDRHIRRQDREFREQLEADKLRLENEKLKTEVVRDRIDILRQLRVPEERIREVLSLHVVLPLRDLEQFQDASVIDDVELLPERAEEGEN